MKCILVMCFSNCQAFSMASFDMTGRPNEDGKTVKGLQNAHITFSQFQEVGHKLGMCLKSWEKLDIGKGASVASVLVSQEKAAKQIYGLHAFQLRGTRLDKSATPSDEMSVNVVLRSKGLDEDWAAAEVEFGWQCSKEEGDAMQEALVVVKGTHRRDVEFARACMEGAWFSTFMPDVYYVATKEDVAQERNFFIMESLGGDGFSHFDAIEGANGVGCWTKKDVNLVLSGIASFHAYYLNRFELLPPEINDLLLDGLQGLMCSEKFSVLVTQRNIERFPDIFTKEESEILRKYLMNLLKILIKLERYPKSVCHNDFNPRNICLRGDPNPDKSHLCVYDWEMAYIHVPQHDIAEFLMFTLPESTTEEELLEYVEYYRQKLAMKLRDFGNKQSVIATIENRDDFENVFVYQVVEFLAVRLSFYFCIAKATETMMPFLPRTARNCFRFLRAMWKRCERDLQN